MICASSNCRPSCAFLREYEKVAAEAAREELNHIRFLLRLAEPELIDRERRTLERRIGAARFPAVKSFDTFDFAAIPSLTLARGIALRDIQPAPRAWFDHRNIQSSIRRMDERLRQSTSDRRPA
jgi:DNA replication protein DnaC